MDYEQRNEIYKQILTFAESKAGSRGTYAYAFGYVSAMLTDEQLETLKKYSVVGVSNA